MGTYSLEMQHLMFRNLQISSELRKHIRLKYQCCVFIVTKSEVRKILKAALKFIQKFFHLINLFTVWLLLMKFSEHKELRKLHQFQLENVGK